MITSRIRLAFRKLAAAGVVELAREHADNPADPQAADAMLNALAEADEGAMSLISDAYQTDQVDKARQVVADFYRNVSIPSNTQKAVERGDASYVINILRQMLQDSLEGLGVSEQSLGFRDELARMRAQEAPENELMEFVDRMYASQIPRLADAYLHTKAPGDITKMEALRRQGADPRGTATRLIRQLLFENIRRMMMADLESSQSFATKGSDAKAYNTPHANVSNAIKYKKTGDQFDQKAPIGEATLKGYYHMYVRPVIDSFQDARGGVDTVGLTEWLNEEFHGTGEPGEKITATTPDGQTTLTAPVSRKEFDIPTVQQWVGSVMQTQSLDAPAGDDEDSTSRAEMVEDKLTTWDEEEKVKYYTENRDRIRGDIAGYIDAAAAEVNISDAEQWREPLRQAMRIKFGFGFEDEWIRGIVTRYGAPAKFYMEAMSSPKWVALGTPKQKHWNQIRNPAWISGRKKGEDKEKKWIFSQEKADKSEFRTYKKDWVQKGLWDKKNKKWADTLPPIQKHEYYEVKDREHKKGEEASTPHFVDYYEYTPKQWAQDMGKAKSNYDGQRWVDELVGKKLKEDLEREGLIRVHKIGPEKLLQAYSTHLDKQLMRALGFSRVTVSPQAGTLYSGNNTFTPGMKAMMRLIWEKAKTNEDVWGYLAYKRVGRVASPDMERTIRLAVDLLMRKAG